MGCNKTAEPVLGLCPYWFYHRLRGGNDSKICELLTDIFRRFRGQKSFPLAICASLNKQIFEKKSQHIRKMAVSSVLFSFPPTSNHFPSFGSHRSNCLHSRKQCSQLRRPPHRPAIDWLGRGAGRGAKLRRRPTTGNARWDPTEEKNFKIQKGFLILDS